MARVHYSGITNPEAAFAALRPFREALIRMQCRCRPFSPDYLVISAVDKALTTAAFHFTRDPEFYSGSPH
jgi:hypothetical protein